MPENVQELVDSAKKLKSEFEDLHKALNQKCNEICSSALEVIENQKMIVSCSEWLLNKAEEREAHGHDVQNSNNNEEEIGNQVMMMELFDKTHEELLSHFIEACNCSKKYLYEIQSVVNESWERPIDVISSCSAELDKKYLGTEWICDRTSQLDQELQRMFGTDVECDRPSEIDLSVGSSHLLEPESRGRGDSGHSSPSHNLRRSSRLRKASRETEILSQSDSDNCDDDSMDDDYKHGDSEEDFARDCWKKRRRQSESKKKRSVVDKQRKRVRKDSFASSSVDEENNTSTSFQWLSTHNRRDGNFPEHLSSCNSNTASENFSPSTTTAIHSKWRMERLSPTSRGCVSREAISSVELPSVVKNAVCEHNHSSELPSRFEHVENDELSRDIELSKFATSQQGHLSKLSRNSTPNHEKSLFSKFISFMHPASSDSPQASANNGNDDIDTVQKRSTRTTGLNQHNESDGSSDSPLGINRGRIKHNSNFNVKSDHYKDDLDLPIAFKSKNNSIYNTDISMSKYSHSSRKVEDCSRLESDHEYVQKGRISPVRNLAEESNRISHGHVSDQEPYHDPLKGSSEGSAHHEYDSSVKYTVETSEDIGVELSSNSGDVIDLTDDIPH